MLVLASAIFGTFLAARASWAQAPATATQASPRLDISGFAMVDTGFQVGQNDPDWFDVVRPTKLPAFKDQFGVDGRWFSGVRQSRLSFRGFIPSDMGEIKTIFEFELFGTGVDAGQTTFRLRHAWGEVGMFGGGQTWSPFMDPDVFPNSVEYWGPSGMVFFRNVQVRLTPWSRGDSNVVIAVERPGASGDGGVYADRVELQNVKPRFRLPDLSGHVRYADDWGHVQIAAIVREIRWDDLNPQQFDLSGSTVGWGVNLSSNLKFGGHVFRLQAVYGQGIENYMNDAPADIGPVLRPENPRTPLDGRALPLWGLVGFVDSTWSDLWSTTLGYSLIDIDNSQGQAPNAFQTGQYALGNVMVYPVKGVMLGPEFQWGNRDNNSDGWHVADYRVQFSMKYNFAVSVGGG